MHGRAGNQDAPRSAVDRDPIYFGRSSAQSKVRLDKVVVYNEQLEKRRFAFLDAAHTLETISVFAIESLVALLQLQYFFVK